MSLHMIDVQSVADGVSQHNKIGLHRLDICQSRSPGHQENKHPHIIILFITHSDNFQKFLCILLLHMPTPHTHLNLCILPNIYQKSLHLFLKLQLSLDEYRYAPLK